MAKRPRSSKLPKIGFFSSLRFKFAFTMALFSGLLMLSVIFLLEQNFRESLVRASIGKGIGIAQGVAFNAEDPNQAWMVPPNTTSFSDISHPSLKDLSNILG